VHESQGLDLSAERKSSQGLELVSIVGSESNVWQSGLRAAGPIRPSLPWDTSRVAAGSAETQVKSRFGASF